MPWAFPALAQEDFPIVGLLASGKSWKHINQFGMNGLEPGNRAAVKPEVFQLHSEIEARHWWFAARRNILFPIIDRVMASAPQNLIVDVGCGTGGTLEYLRHRYQCLGIDSSELAINAASQTYPGVEYVLGMIPDALAARSSKIGLFLLMDVIEHVQEDRKFLTNLIDLARPGSHIIITVPAIHALWSAHDVAANHFRRYEIDQLRSLLVGMPIEVRLMTFFNSRLYPVIRAARMLGNLMGRSLGRSGTDFAIPPFGLNEALTRIFSGEGPRILDALDRGDALSYQVGSSLLAVLRRK